MFRLRTVSLMDLSWQAKRAVKAKAEDGKDEGGTLGTARCFWPTVFLKP